jgi:molybdate transport system substrate-binding protein
VIAGWQAIPVVCLCVAGVVGCGDDDEDPVASVELEPVGDSEQLLVSAASSLTSAFAAMEPAFEEANEGVDLVFTFDSSSTLVTQVFEGAPVDVIATADESNMADLVDEGLVAGEPTVFARNRLVIIVPTGNPAGIESLADLAELDVVALCGEDVPCGEYAAEALDDAGVTIDEGSVTRGQNAGATTAAVAEGDADAGIVYVTDQVAVDDATDAVEIPDEVNVIAAYPISVLAAGSAPAAAFVSYVTGPDGQATLAELGFLAP